MSGFCAVNTTLTVMDPPLPKSADDATPTTPRPGKFFADEARIEPPAEDPSAKTPTRESFAGIAGQKPLPDVPFTQEQSRTDSMLDMRSSMSREPSQISTGSGGSFEDVQMKDDKEDGDGSDGENVDDETGRPSRKKKGQRFFCTDFPPCELSFTRSEHLARHIR
jgi:C2H2 transcription facotor